MLFGELKRHIRAGKLQPAYLVTGEDAFLRSSAISQLCALATPLPEFNVSELSSPESTQEIIEACESLPVTAPYRVVIVRQCKLDLSPLGGYLADPCPTTVLVLCAEKPDAGITKIVSKLTVVDCTHLTPDTVLAWIAANAEKQNARITAKAAQMLCDYCACDMSRVSAELNKLCAYRDGDVIGEQDVEALVSPTLDFKLFALGDAVANKQSARAATVLKSLTDGGTSPILLLGMLYAHFRRLLYVAITPSYERMPADLGVKEFAVRKAKEQAARFTPRILKKICDNLQAADHAVKSGKLPDDVALQTVIFRALAA